MPNWGIAFGGVNDERNAQQNGHARMTRSGADRKACTILYTASHSLALCAACTVYSAATSHRLPGAAALTYLTNFIVPGGRSVRLSALLIAWIEVTPSDESSAL